MTIRMWIADGRLATHKPGRRVLIDRATLLGLIGAARRGV